MEYLKSLEEIDREIVLEIEDKEIFEEFLNKINNN